MAGEKITLEVVSKLVDKGFKLAKQQIEQIRKLEKKRYEKQKKIVHSHFQYAS